MTLGRRVRIGTAGWAIPKLLRPDFDGEGTILERYARRLETVEINSSFYRPHLRKTYERWAASVDDAFRFSVKAPKAITHDARLVDIEAPLLAFLDQSSGLGAKRGVILLQCPPSLAFDLAALAVLLAILRRASDTPLACEPRHASWFTQETEAWLEEHGVARVMADPALHKGADRPGGWRGLSYYRLHGSPRTYYSSYAPERLAGLAQAIDADPARSLYCIFDNTASGAALENARDLQPRLQTA